jgi:hypothetical protein
MGETADINVHVIEEGGAGKGGAGKGGAGAASSGDKEEKPTAKKSEQSLSGINKLMASGMKMMKKMNPVFDTSNIIVNLLRKSSVIMAVLEPLMDIIMAYVDTFLATLMPIIAPILKLLAGLLPEFQILISWIQPFLEPIAKVLETLAKWVTEGAKILKGLADKFQLGSKVGKAMWNSSPLGMGAKAVGGIISGGKKLLGFQSGTSYVPHNMVAQLHKGESVLTARETQQRKTSGVNPALTIQNPSFTINAGGRDTMDAKVFASRLYKEFTKSLVDEARRA